MRDGGSEARENFNTFTHYLIDSVGKINGDIVKAQAIGPLMQSSKWGHVSATLTELRDLCTSASGIYEKIYEITVKLQDLLQLAGTSANPNSRWHGESIKLIGSIFQIRKEVFRAYCLEGIRRGSDVKPDMRISSEQLHVWAQDEIRKKGESLDELPALESVRVKTNESGGSMVVNNRASYLATLKAPRTLYCPDFTTDVHVFPEADRECLRADVAAAAVQAAAAPPPALPTRLGAAAADGGAAAAPPPPLPTRLGAELPPRRAAAVAAAAAAATAAAARIPSTIHEYNTDDEDDEDDEDQGPTTGQPGRS